MDVISKAKQSIDNSNKKVADAKEKERAVNKEDKEKMLKAHFKIMENAPTFEQRRNQDHLLPTQFHNWYWKVNGVVNTPLTYIIPFPLQAYIDLLDAKTTPVLYRLADHISILANHVGVPAFLRSSISSAKHFWDDACNLSSSDPAKILDHLYRIVEYTEMGMGPIATTIAVRRMIQTQPYFYSFMGNLPITREFRLFLRDGKVECIHPYWPEEAFEDRDDISTENWKKILQDMYNKDYGIEHIVSETEEKLGPVFKGYWSVDWLEGEGTWWLIDMAEGDKSYHYPRCSVRSGNGT